MQYLQKITKDNNNGARKSPETSKSLFDIDRVDICSSAKPVSEKERLREKITIFAKKTNIHHGICFTNKSNLTIQLFLLIMSLPDFG